MTKQQLLAGDKFEYNGHFQLMSKEVALRLVDGFIVDQHNERFCFLMGEAETFFMVWKLGYGTIRVMFAECKIKSTEYD